MEGLQARARSLREILQTAQSSVESEDGDPLLISKDGRKDIGATLHHVVREAYSLVDTLKGSGDTPAGIQDACVFSDVRVGHLQAHGKLLYELQRARRAVDWLIYFLVNASTHRWALKRNVGNIARRLLNLSVSWSTNMNWVQPEVTSLEHCKPRQPRRHDRTGGLYPLACHA